MSPTSKPPVRPLKVALASFVGTSIEWYDFFLYATAAALVFGKLFFPTVDPVTGTLAAFATYTIGFLARPIGGVLFGHLGDRIGRKKSLVASLLIMGGGTFLIGLLPTYASIGALAPALLVVLRFLQGIAVGGEWGGAVLLAVEHAPQSRRTLYGAFAQLGAPAGLLLSTLVITLMGLLPGGAFLAWGWRVPFLASAVLIVIGLVVRLRVEETPEFEALRRAEQPVRLPVAETFRAHWRAVVLGIGAVIISIGGFYIVSTFMLAYATQQLGMSRQTVLDGQLVIALVEGFSLLFFARLGDRIGRRPVAIGGALFTAAWAFPLFALAHLRSALPLWMAMGVGILGITAVYAVIAALVSELFPARVRYTGISVAYQISGVLGGGLAPLLATYLLKTFHGASWPAAVFLIAMSLVTAGCVAATRTTADRQAAAEAGDAAAAAAAAAAA